MKFILQPNEIATAVVDYLTNKLNIQLSNVNLLLIFRKEDDVEITVEADIEYKPAVPPIGPTALMSTTPTIPTNTPEPKKPIIKIDVDWNKENRSSTNIDELSNDPNSEVGP